VGGVREGGRGIECANLLEVVVVVVMSLVGAVFGKQQFMVVEDGEGKVDEMSRRVGLLDIGDIDDGESLLMQAANARLVAIGKRRWIF